jgi:4-amino-4-deoxy-L-arabinose transferase-like glycosyltransferase
MKSRHLNRFLIKQGVFIVFAVNILFRLINIDYGSYYLDEAANLWHFQQGPDVVLERGLNDVNPPVYGWLIFFWIKLFGITEIATRSFSVIAMALCGASLFTFSKRYFNFKVALTVAVLFLFSDFIFKYSHAARPYALLCFQTTLSYFFLYAYTQKKRGILLLAVLVTNVIMLYTHPTGVFNIAAQGIYLLIFIRSDFRTIFKAGLVLIMSIGAYYIWFSICRAFDKQQVTWLDMPNLLNLEYTVWRLLDGLWLLVILITGMAILAWTTIKNRGFRRGGLRRFRLTCLLLLWVVVPFIVNVILSHVANVSIFTPHYLIVVLPGFYFLLGVILFYAGKKLKVRTIFLIAPVAITMAVTLNYWSTFEEDWRSAANYTKAHQTDKTAVFLSPQYQNRSFAFYYDRSFYEQSSRTFELLDSCNVFLQRTTPIEKLMADDRFEEMLFVLIAPDPDKDPNLVIAKDRSELTSHVNYGDIHIYQLSLQQSRN